MTYVLGVDLGTTFTAAAICESGSEPRMLSLGSNSYAVPSVVFLREDGSFLTGEAAELQSSSDPTRVARHFKRRLGDDVPIRLAGTAFPAELLVTQLLEWVVGQATERRGQSPAKVVFTHPANWGPFRTEMLAEAAVASGVGDPVLLSEPEAAAIHYVQSERLDVGDLIGVYDLGGGTFDAVIMRRRSDGFEAIGRPVGVERLGGVDFDEAIRAFVLEAAELQDIEHSEEVVSAAYALQASCVAAKRVLSADTVAHVRVVFPGVSKTVRINRAEFENRIRPRLQETLDAFDTAVQSAGIPIDDLSRILLVGGSSRIPLVSALLSQRFARPLAVDTDPKNTVALGAALFGTAVEAPDPGDPPAAPAQPVPPTLPARATTEPAAAGHRQPDPTAVPPVASESAGELLGVRAESGHRARIPQSTPAPVHPQTLDEEPTEAEAVGIDPRLVAAAVAIVLLVLVAVAVVVVRG